MIIYKKKKCIAVNFCSELVCMLTVLSNVLAWIGIAHRAQLVSLVLVLKNVISHLLAIRILLHHLPCLAH